MKKVIINDHKVNETSIEVQFSFIGKKKNHITNIDLVKYEKFLTDKNIIGTFDREEEFPFMIGGEIEVQSKTTEYDFTLEDYFLHTEYDLQEVHLANYLFLNPIQPPLSRLMQSAWIMAKEQCITIGQALKLAWQMAKLVGKKLTITFFKKDKSIRTVQGAEILGLKGNVVLYKEDEQIKSFISTNLISSHISE